MASKKQQAAEKEHARTGKVKTLYLEDDVNVAFEAYKAAQKIVPSEKAIFNYAMRKFLTEEGFYPAKPKE